MRMEYTRHVFFVTKAFKIMAFFREGTSKSWCGAVVQYKAMQYDLNAGGVKCEAITMARCNIATLLDIAIFMERNLLVQNKMQLPNTLKL